MKKRIIFSVFLPTLCICLTTFNTKSFAGNRRTSFTVMTYNLENLYDATHDEGTKDYSYLPLRVKQRSEEVQTYCSSIRSPYYRERCFTMDWNAAVVKKKVENISKVIKRANNNKSPDILIFQEVENLNILNILRDVGLKGEGYIESALIEGPDSRGIDVAILSKIPIAGKPKYHNIDLSSAYEPGQRVRTTRGILEVKFLLKDNKFIVLANHWPSQANSDKTRFLAAKKLIKVCRSLKYPAIIAGDFNSLENDELNAINELMIGPKSKFPFWDIEKVYFDEQQEYRTTFLNLVPHRGTHNYKGEWSSLDRIFVPKNHVHGNCKIDKRCLRPEWASYQVVKFPFMLHDLTYQDRDTGEDVTYFQVPMRFNPKTKKGYSDHLPVISKFSL